MSQVLITSDLHLGHANAIKWRDGFASSEEHDNVIFDNLASAVGPRDTLYLLGDIAFTWEWSHRIAQINCAKKILILGNHDTERSLSIRELALHYDSIHSLMSKKNLWLSHCPIHESELRGRAGNIHGHTHSADVPDERYFNVCVERTNYKPMNFEHIKEVLL